MSPEQLAAFQQGAGGVAAGDLLLVIAMTVMTALTLWTAWVALGQMRAWQEGQATLFDMLWAILRASILLLLVGFFVQP